MSNSIKKFLSNSLTIIFLAGIDQLSKTFLISFLKTQHGMVYKISSFFSLVYAWNYGISFGLFADYYQYSNYFFLALNCLITGYLIHLMLHTSSKTQSFGIAMIIGGALGNVIDRIIRGAVFDFLYFHYDHRYFPAFNLADSFINIGVGIIVLSYLTSGKK